MEREEANYGVQREYEAQHGAQRGAYPAPPPPLYGAISAQDERTWSTLAHLSTFLNPFTGFLGPVVAFVIWLVYRESSPTVASHALRSVFYQVTWLGVILVGWAVTTLLMAVAVGFLLVPVMVLVTLAPFVHASYEAYRAYRGGGRRYL